MSSLNENFHQVLEAAIFAAGEPLTIEKLAGLFDEPYRPTNNEIREALQEIAQWYQPRGVELIEVSSGYRFQAKVEYADWLQKLWEKKPPRYSRALLETLALIAYQQPITRGEIEDVRGVAVSTNIMKILQERDWIKVVGHKDVPGKPALFATTKVFLDYFNLKSLAEMPPLESLADLDEIEQKLSEQMELNMDQQEQASENREKIQDDVDLESSDQDSSDQSESQAHIEINEVIAKPELNETSPESSALREEAINDNEIE